MSSLTCGARVCSGSSRQPNLAKTPAGPTSNDTTPQASSSVGCAGPVRHDGREAQAASSSYPGATTATATRRATFTSASRRSATTSRSSACRPATASPGRNIFSHSLFVPQYNVRSGIFFNERWGLELALDHMKWIVRQDQEVRDDRHAERGGGRLRRSRSRRMSCGTSSTTARILSSST